MQVYASKNNRNMATNWEKVKEELTCAICQDLLNDPKILPCLHSFCTGCLKRELECPLCRGKVALSTPRAVEELPSHFSAVRLVEIVSLQEQASSKKVTPICQSCEEEQATSCCNECAIFLCNFCEKAHRKVKATRDHEICSLDDMKKTSGQIPSILPEKIEMCPVHPTKPLELYCRCEEMLICRDCIIKKHKDHDYDVISDVIDVEKKILQEALPGIQQLIDEVEGAINGVKSKRQDVKNRKEENLHRLDDAFNTLHTALDERKRQLQQQITQDTEGKDNGLGVQEDEMCFLLSQLKSCWSFINDKLQRGVSKDVLAMKRSMLERRDKLKEMESKTKLNPVSQEHSLINVKGTEKIIHQIRLFCNVQECCTVVDLKDIVPIGKKNCFTLQLKDFLGNDICNSKELDILVQYDNKDRVTEVATIREIGSGSYEASYVRKFGGSHTVSVQVGGEPVPGSPFKVTTTLRDYTKIEVQNCQLITQYGGKKFQCPYDITTTTNDDVVMVDYTNKDVVILNKDMKLIRSFGQGSGDSKLNNPVGVAVGHNVIAVSEYDDHVVKKFTLQGDYLSKFGSCGSGDGQFTNPQGLTFNSKGLLYVVDRSNYRIQLFDNNNKFLFKFGSEGFNPGQFQDPCYIALDSSDQVYVTDYDSSGGIIVFNEDGHFIKKINCNNPLAFCLTPDDYIITDPGNTLTVFSPTHQMIIKFGSYGSQRGQFNNILGIAVNSVGTIFVTEEDNHRLQVITT
ncbi:E3 ubiquitin-protein ligase TRIM71-like isoform X2 [Dysidea avara]|uniref:E3 ubiquitin-protein ligase TRIM71-like isoform X2 n=1 Tax=Dysidea avara TaxID=196820 RepID=UPI00332F953E